MPNDKKPRDAIRGNAFPMAPTQDERSKQGIAPKQAPVKEKPTKG
jgi:hypothetical protein